MFSINKGYSNKFHQVLSLLAVVLMMLAVSVRRDGKWLGHQLKPQPTAVAKAAGDTVRTLPDGSMVINTTGLGKDIIGYGGTVPLELTVKDNKVVSVKALDNTETPDFFERASVLLHRWDGMTLDEASDLQVDAVSGATFSSKAIIGNVRRGLQYAQQSTAKESVFAQVDLSAKAIAGLVVALMAAIVPLFYKNKRYRVVHQVLNTVVLGFWCGSFVSYSALIGYTFNGMNILALLVPVIMLITAFIYPLFGKKSYYCTHVCPFGAVQELANRCVPYQLKLGNTTVKRLDTFRQVLWAALMLCLWTGVWFDWVDAEPFSAFIFESASWAAIAIAVTFALLSTVIMRPYCRFVCPMGTLFKIAQKGR